MYFICQKKEFTTYDGAITVENVECKNDLSPHFHVHHNEKGTFKVSHPDIIFTEDGKVLVGTCTHVPYNPDTGEIWKD